jgi:hypothetical protein
MPTLTWKDNRLPADDVAPWDTTVMFVGPKITVGELVSDSVDWCQKYDGQGKNLMIYCHGSPGFLLLCKEGVNLRNVGKLDPLRPYFDTVSIHACLVAKGEAGRTFCSKLAHVLVAPVDGAVELQYNTGPQTIYGYLDDQKYDGDYYRHQPSGERVGPLRSR